MAFRANEQKRDLLAKAIRKMTAGLDASQRPAAASLIEELAAEHGPVVERYPVWHPFAAGAGMSNWVMSGDPLNNHDVWADIDHPVYFANALISCPYNNGEKLFASVDAINKKLAANGHTLSRVSAQHLTTPLYHARARPVLVTANLDLDEQGAVSTEDAITGFLRACISLSTAFSREVAEPWENVKEFFLGMPCGTRSSLFVTEKAGASMKRMMSELNKSGVYGDVIAPLNVPRR